MTFKKGKKGNKAEAILTEAIPKNFPKLRDNTNLQIQNVLSQAR